MTRKGDYRNGRPCRFHNDPLVAKTGGLALTHPLRPIAELILIQISERTRQVREEQKRADALQQKLDALKAIEKQLLDRERRRN